MSGIKGKWWGFVAKNRIHQCLQWTVHFFSLSRNSANLGPLSRPIIRKASNVAFQQISVYLPSCFCRIREALGWRRILKKLRGFTPNNWFNFWSKKNHILHFWEKMLSRFGKKREGNWTDFFPNVDFDAFRWDFLSRVDCTSFEFSSQSWGFLAPWNEPAELNPTVNWIEPAQLSWAKRQRAQVTWVRPSELSRFQCLPGNVSFFLN